MNLREKKIVIIGGTSGIGLATAKAAVQDGGYVIIASRSSLRLEAARKEIGSPIDARPLDMTNEDLVREFFNIVGPIDHLVVTASSVKNGPFRELPTQVATDSMKSKFWGPYLAVKHASINSSGSIVLFSGILSRRPFPGMAMLAAINAAVEALGRALAVELSPIRVNVISPGLVQGTGAYDGMPPGAREGMFRAWAERSLLKRVGNPEDIARTVIHLMTNPYMTGTVIDVDGGGLLV